MSIDLARRPPVPARGPVLPGRAREPEEECALRTPFQRDRDRIVHCKAFRRLKHKTQVFVAPEGDHYRTRLTHTLEVTQISRTVGARAAAQRGPGRGDRARPRPRPPAVRPHRRGGARPLRARALRPRLPPQRALAARRRRARAPQPHRAGPRRHPAPLHRGGGARDARGQDRAPRRPHRLHQPRHRRRRARRACCEVADLPARGDRRARRHRLAADRHARARPRRALRARGGHRPGRGGRRRDDAPARLHVPARLPRPDRARGARARSSA